MTEKKRTMTIKDIALHTGLSKGTVDRVLHNRGEVSKKSYEKVMRYIEESGYTPNVHASLLASRMDRQIAVLLPHHEPGSFWELAQKGLSEAEESVTGLGLLVRRVGYEQFDVDSFNKACEEILGSAPDGVVIAPMFRSQTAVLTERLRQKGIPYVYIDSKLEEDDYMAYFGMPMYQSGYMCGALLTNGMPVDEAVMIRIRRDKNRLSDPTVNRRAGFLDYMQENFPDCKIHNLFIEPTDPAANATVLDGFFSEHPGIRHIVMFNSRIHLIVNYLEEHPERKWRVVGFDNLPLNNEALKRGTVTILIAQRPDEQVRLAVQALADKILFKKDPVHRDHYMPMDILTRFNVDYY
ncbi:MAG: LacI family DNA-binding transcriptional regulator [Bacteroidales bacterium]|nr:LacI family DNA-binding transcriptional regulator [Bacteroidales bacterium]